MKPILFNTEMVKAILDGRKTCTRRVIKPQPEGRPICMPLQSAWPGYFAITGTEKVIKPPYRPGDILYVQETWNGDWCDHYIYKADGGSAKAAGYGKEPKWRPSIHMPKEAARLFLRVTSVRVERLQDITDEGAMDEGIDGEACDCEGPFFCSRCCNTGFITAPRSEFVSTWNRTVKKANLPLYGWDANPWVWVIVFKQISKEEALKGGF